MQIPSRFTIAVHILTLIAQNKGNETKLTSDLMASSVGVNPSYYPQNLITTEESRLDFCSKGKWRIDISHGTRGD